LAGGQDAEGEVLDAAPLDLPGGAHPGGVGVQQHAEQGLGVEGGVAVPVGPVAAQERAEIELVDHVQDEPGEVAFGEPVAQVGGQQEGLVAVAAKEVVDHGAAYLFAPLVPNAWVLEDQRLSMCGRSRRLLLARRCDGLVTSAERPRRTALVLPKAAVA
jgi:hypothetical protein